jgi:hypothetical protein
MTTATQITNDLYCLSSAGFAIIPDFLSPETVSSLQKKTEAWIEEVRAYEKATSESVGYGSGWPLENIRCLYAIDEAFRALAMDARLQAYAHSYLGEYEIGDVQVLSNMPDERYARLGPQGPVHFHRDHVWQEDQDPPYALHCFMPLTDMTRENGATVIVPGSHRTREPNYPFAESEERERADDNSTSGFRRRLFPSSISLEAPSGSLVLIDPMAIHSQGNNISETPRTVLNVAFKQRCLRGQLNGHAIAMNYSRAEVDPDFLKTLVCNDALPGTYGPLE